jgi:membrane-associated phospholipid phosphatase
VRTIEGAKRHAVAGCAACAAGLAMLVALAYWVPPFEQLDETVLNAVSDPPGSFVHGLAFFVEQLVSPAGQVVAVVMACLLALALGRPNRAFLAVALVAGTAVIVQILKIALEHPRYQPVPGEPFEWFPAAKAFPSGNSAGALSIALAFLYVVPASWRRLTAAVGIAFTLAVSLGLLVLNYHYPSDILGGWLVALGWCLALEALRQRRDRAG